MTQREKPTTAEKSAENMEVEDHTQSFSRGDDDLIYHFHNIPEDVEIVNVSDGILWARIPLPWSLDHINVYLIEEGDGWTLIDTGAQGKPGRDLWRRLEKTVLGGKPILNVIATHMHPDHLGLAGWLVKRHGATFYCTYGEYFLAMALWLGAKPKMPQHDIEFLFRAGVRRDREEQLRNAGHNGYKRVVHRLPEAYVRLEDGLVLTLGGRRFQVIIGRGHSPEHACLLCLDEPLFISGDQVLPDITSNVSVTAREPRGNPLAYWMSSLNRLHGIDTDPLVLPSHGRPFFGLQNRLNTLLNSHTKKLKRLHTHLETRSTPIEAFPALFRRKVSGLDFFLALGEALSHLHLLESLGLAERGFEDGVYRFERTGIFEDINILASLDAMPGVALRPLDSLKVSDKLQFHGN